MATIERRERKTGTVYQADVRIKGFPRQKKTFKRLTDARIWAQETEVAIRNGEFRNVQKAARKTTFEKLIKRYRSEIHAHKTAKTRSGEKRILERWEESFGKYMLSSIDSALINRTLKEIEAEGVIRKKGVKKCAGAPSVPPKSRRTMKYYRDTLAMVFRHAKKWGLIGHDPMEDVKPITKLGNERTRYLSDDERTALLEACKKNPNRQLYPIVVFALSTGARKGEILGLTLEDVSLARETAVFRNTKNGDIRVVPIVGHLKDVIREQVAWAKAEYDKKPEAFSKHWLFPSQDGRKPIDIRNPWEQARKAAELVDFRFHDLRHSTASYLAMSGASQLEIAEVLGHRTLHMVKRYAHLSESHVKGLVEGLDKQLF